VPPQFGRRVRRVQEEEAAGPGSGRDIETVEQTELVTGDHVGLVDQIGRADRPGPETQM